MENETVIGFIGAGNMAYALINGLLNNGYDSKNIKASDPNNGLLRKREEELNITTFTNNSSLVEVCDVIVFAVKPQVLSEICLELREKIKPKHLFISIVAGIRVNDINRWLGGNYSLVRTMPNTPALMQRGVTGLFPNELVNDEQKALVTTILSSVGHCFWVNEEILIDAITAISGSGPAYFFLLMESMTQAGVALGLDEKTAQELSVQTGFGASLMATKSGKSPRTLRIMSLHLMVQLKPLSSAFKTKILKGLSPVQQEQPLIALVSSAMN